MDLDITIKNYRCFPDSKPARIRLRDGFTAFVGANNSGKSTILKMFFEFREIFSHLSNPNSFIDRLPKTAAFGFQKPVSDKDEFFHNGNERDITLEFTVINDLPDTENHKNVLVTIPHNTNTHHVKFPTLDPITVEDKLELANNGNLTIIRDAHGGKAAKPGPRRNLNALCEAFSNISNCQYIGAFRNAINIGTKEDYFDIQIGQSFIQQWHRYKTGGAIRENKLAYRVTQDIAHLFDINQLEINASDDGQSLKIFMDGKPFQLAELGSGLTQFIVVLANVAIRQPTFILIDEPELNLHPPLQLDFLTSLGSL